MDFSKGFYKMCSGFIIYYLEEEDGFHVPDGDLNDRVLCCHPRAWREDPGKGSSLSPRGGLWGPTGGQLKNVLLRKLDPFRSASPASLWRARGRREGWED